VRAAGINFADTLFRNGQYVMQPQLPDTPGALKPRVKLMRSARA